MAEGHPDARHYALGVLATETEIARKRKLSERVNEAVLFQAAIPASFSKKASTAFRKLVEKLSGDAE